MKCVAFGITLILPLWANKMLGSSTAENIPAVPKVQNADAEGIPVLPGIDSFMGEVSREVKDLSAETTMLLGKLRNGEQASRTKMHQEKANWEQLLKKQEKENQKIQAENAGRAKKMMKLRDLARETRAEIKKAEDVNRKRRAELKALQQQLRQAQKATEDALGGSDEGKARRELSLAQVHEATKENEDDVRSNDLGSTGIVPDQPMVGEELTRMPVSFLEVETKPASKPIVKPVESTVEDDDDYGSNDAATQETHGTGSIEASRKLAHSPAKASHNEGPQTHQVKATSKTTRAAHDPAKDLNISPAATAAKLSVAEQEHATSSSTDPVGDAQQHSGSDALMDKQAQQVFDTAESPEMVEQAAKDLDADDRMQVLHEGVSVAESVVASLSSGLKKVHEQTQRSESKLKRSFQSAYKAGKARHDALIKQSKALEKSMLSMQLQEQKLEATLAKAQSTGKVLKQKIHSIGAFVGKAVAPISSEN